MDTVVVGEQIMIQRMPKESSCVGQFFPEQSEVQNKCCVEAFPLKE